MITRQMTPFFSSTLWTLSGGIFYFCISRSSKFNFMGSQFSIIFWSVKCKLTCQVYKIKNLHAKYDTFMFVNIDILFLKFVNFWYITCFVPNSIPIWSHSVGLSLWLTNSCLKCLPEVEREPLKYVNTVTTLHNHDKSLTSFKGPAILKLYFFKTKKVKKSLKMTSF